MVRRPSIDEFGGLFDPLLEIERSAFCQNDPAEYSARMQHVAHRESEPSASISTADSLTGSSFVVGTRTDSSRVRSFYFLGAGLAYPRQSTETAKFARATQYCYATAVCDLTEDK